MKPSQSEYLIRLLAEHYERTFATEGQAAGNRLLVEMLSRLDEQSLRELVYQRGLTTEADLEPDESESHPG
jgi:hypothetical protein